MTEESGVIIEEGKRCIECRMNFRLGNIGSVKTFNWIYRIIKVKILSFKGETSGRSRQRNGVLSSQLPVGWDGDLRSGSVRTGLLAVLQSTKRENIFLLFNPLPFRER
ncbi:hypothetical protein D5R40_02500 [Okeania hirsuta]|uniref:Uncharacterized protein n=1 Tax=Okeania hirsuta TaxID=1458930 RepID=A0A3N6NXB6_9CYAN|nr:hypothetical protein D4Z78_05610 [Okeania hirsuta]RQH55432.1 hypothetical protein D5R40_02500 [Okeania hirsuta]